MSTPDDTACKQGEICSVDTGCTSADPCGNGVCDPKETAQSCPGDCLVCGDGVCDAGESAASCPTDCTTTCTVDDDCDDGAPQTLDLCHLGSCVHLAL
jgi:hypothetical protein